MIESANWYLVRGQDIDPSLNIDARMNGNIIVFDEKADSREQYRFLRFLYSENTEITPINDWTYSVTPKSHIDG